MEDIREQIEDIKATISANSSRLDLFSGNINSLSCKLEELHSEFCELKDSNKRALDILLPRVEELLTNRPSNESNSLIDDRITTNAECASSLFQAAQNDDVEVLVHLLKDGVNVLQRNEQGDCALHVAARAGHESAVIVLVGNCAVDVRGNRGRTPLHYASAQGHVTVVRRLLSAGANVDSKDGSGDFALLIAINNRYLHIAELLINQRAALDAVDREGNSVLVAAAKSKHWDIVEFLLQRGAPADVYIRDDDNPLHWVSKERKYHLIPLMLNNVKGKEKQMRLALVQTEDANLVYEFERALPGFCRSEEGREAMDKLTRAGKVDILRSFLDVGGDPNVQNVHGYTCLIIACREGKHEIVKMLLDRGASVDLQHWINRSTALHLAAQYGHVECVHLLLAAGASSTIKDTAGKTAVHYANIEKIRQILISHNSQS